MPVSQSVSAVTLSRDQPSENIILKLFELEERCFLFSQGVDLADLQTGISGVFFWALNFENLYFWGTAHSCCIFFGLLNKCCIFKCFIFLTVFFGSSFMHLVLQ